MATGFNGSMQIQILGRFKEFCSELELHQGLTPTDGDAATRPPVKRSVFFNFGQDFINVHIPAHKL
jgi:hypothetical protein